MHVLLERRNIYELEEVHLRSYGLTAAEIPTTVKLNLSHNHLRSLQRPLVHTTRGDVRAASDTDTVMPSSFGTVSAGASPMSLEKRRSALSPFTALAHLLVNHNQLRSLVGLCGAADTLTVLIATHNSLTSLDGMQACKRLTYVDLSYNSIESLQGLPLMLAAPSPEAASESTAELPHRGASAMEGASFATPPMTDGAAAKHDEKILFRHVNGDANEGAASISTPPIPTSPHPWLGAKICQHSHSPNGAGHLRHHCYAHHSQSQQQQPPSGQSLGDARSLATRPEQGAKTSIRLDVGETVMARSATTGARASSKLVATSAAADASPPSSGADSGSGNIGGDKVSVVLILSHNRLRGRALSGMVWVASTLASNGTAQGRTPSSAHLLLRPWCTALTHLDLSHNYIEDARDVRRLFSLIHWPSSPSPSSAAAVTCAPALACLQCLDVSGNPFLVNGSLADELARSSQSPPSATAELSWTSSMFSCTNARRPVIEMASDLQSDGEREGQGSVEATVMNAGHAVVPSVQFRLNYASRTMSAALQGASSLASAVTFPSLAAAQGAMDTLLASLANRWQCTAPSPPPPVTATMFALFSPADTRAVVEKVPQRCTVHLHGGELTVLAAALQQRGARLGEMLEVHVSVPGLYAKRATASATPSATSNGRSPPPSSPSRSRSDARTAVAMATGADTSRSIFLTPPPRWTRNTSVSMDVSVLSGGRVPSPPAARRLTTPMAPSSVPAASPTAAAVEMSQDAESVPEDALSTSSNTCSVERSTVGYRLYQGRAHQRQPGSVADKSSGSSGTAVAHVDGTSGSGVAAVSHAATASLSADAVELQLLRAEVVELRRRYRELQRKTHDQTCVLKRQEATIRELKKTAAFAQQESQAELSMAQLEIRRLRKQVQVLNDLATQAAPPEPTSVSPALSAPLQLPYSDEL
ncbi:hypothetical protein, unknown function [Leishmania tarentolae]|uniref:Leucine-rich repeat protein n=1 Tax=Leishmania tarentolae TaxID=5689 RepID=A0A640K9Q7_LEITA|nr:hypothetical protein, unknown function [Leishmania tarentolae]